MKLRLLIIPILLACFLVVGCSSDKAWRKAAVDSYEILGITISATPTISENLKASGTITDEQLVKIKGIYGKARAIYIAAGNALKLASALIQRLRKRLLFRTTQNSWQTSTNYSHEIQGLITSFTQKKVSLLEIRQWVEGGVL